MLQTLIAPAALAMDVLEMRAQVRQDAPDDDPLLTLGIRATTTFAQAACRRTLIATRYRLTLNAFPGPSFQGLQQFVDWSIPDHAVLLEYGPVLAVQSITYLDMTSTRQTMAATDYAVDSSGLLTLVTPVFGKIWQPTLPQIGAVQITFDAGDAAAITVSGSTIAIKGGIWKPLNVGDAVRFSNSGGALPIGLTPDTDFFVTATGTGTLSVSATLGGSSITFTDTGTGTSYIGAIDEGIKAWMKLRATSLYDLRADMNVLNRGKLEPLPYVDELLDPYRSPLA